MGTRTLRTILVAVITAVFGLSFHLAPGYAQDKAAEEIVVRFEVPKLFQKDIYAQFKSDSLYLPLLEIFSLLSVKTEVAFENQHFWGEFNSPENKFDINLVDAKAKCFGRELTLNKREFILTPADLFLRLDIFDSLFRLKMNFEFSNLSVYLPLDKDFPAYQKMVRRLAHKELTEQAVLKRDYASLPYKKASFRGGVADWTLTANPVGGGEHFGSLNLGGMVLGGDLSLQGSAASKTGVQTDQFRYRWHYYFENNKYVTQLEAGNLYTSGMLGRNMRGLMLTNKPQVERRYFQSLNVAGHQGEGWEIELYINNRLTDFAYTDQNGDYNFLVDILYGSSRIMLKMYGPSGEVLTEEKFVSVPYNFIPKGTIEYSVAGGLSDQQVGNGRYAQGFLFYGIFNNLTAGINTDIPINAEGGIKTAWAGELNYHPVGNLILNGTYSPDYSARVSFNYSQPSIIGLNGSYTRYYENPIRNRLNQISGMQLSISSPLKFGRHRLGLRYHITRDKYPDYNRLNMNYGFNTSLFNFNFNYIGTYKMIDFLTRRDREITSQVIFSTVLIRWVRPQMRLNYDHTLKQLSGLGIYLNKRVFKNGQITLSLERNMQARSNLIMMTLNMFTGYADLSTKLYASKGLTAISQMQRGSIRFDQQAGRFRFDRKTGIGYGSAVVWPFLDDNYNGLRDNGEQILTDLRAKVGGAYGTKSKKEGVYYYDGLRPYDQYTVTIDPYSLDNPQWQPAHEGFVVSVMPNTVTEINIPIITAGEISGTVDRHIPDGKVGVGGINIMIVNEATGKETKLTSFNNGEFYYMGLVPGVYRAVIESEQLNRYGYASDPPSISFQIKTIAGGDNVSNLNFLIIPKPESEDKSTN